MGFSSLRVSTREMDPQPYGVGLAVGGGYQAWGRLEEVLEGLWGLEGTQLKVGAGV